MKPEKGAWLAVAVTVVSLAGCSAVGDPRPISVEEKAAKLLADSEKAIPSAAPAASISHSGWQSCGEETPGTKTFDYTRTMQLSIDDADQQSIVDQVTAAWRKVGYSLQPIDPADPSREVKLTSDGDWSLTVRPATDGQIFLIADSGCVRVSPSPKTG